MKRLGGGFSPRPPTFTPMMPSFPQCSPKLCGFIRKGIQN